MWTLFYCFCFITARGYYAEAASQRSYELTFERLEKVLVDKTYLDPGTVRVTRVNRTHTVIMGEFQVLQQIDDDVMATILTYEKSSGTEYKRSAAVSLKNKPVCSFLNSDTAGVRDFKASTNLPEQCPILPGKYIINSFVLDPEKFPPHIPASYFRGDLFVTKDEITWIHVQAFVRIEQKKLFG